MARTEGHQSIQPEQIDYAGRCAATKMKTVKDLFCVVGASYMVNTNIDVTKGIANGTIATFYDIILIPSAKIRIISLEDGNEVHSIFADEVKCVILKHTNPAQNKKETLPVCRPVAFQLYQSSATLRANLGPPVKILKSELHSCLVCRPLCLQAIRYKDRL